MNHLEALDVVIGRTRHERFRALCDDAHPDHAAWRERVIAMAGCEESPPAGSSHIAAPLAGDRIAAWARRTGLDRLATAWERLTGRPCGCDARRTWLNRIHAKIKASLSRKA